MVSACVAGAAPPGIVIPVGLGSATLTARSRGSICAELASRADTFVRRRRCCGPGRVKLRRPLPLTEASLGIVEVGNAVLVLVLTPEREHLWHHASGPLPAPHLLHVSSHGHGAVGKTGWREVGRSAVELAALNRTRGRRGASPIVLLSTRTSTILFVIVAIVGLAAFAPSALAGTALFSALAVALPTATSSLLALARALAFALFLALVTALVGRPSAALAFEAIAFAAIAFAAALGLPFPWRHGCGPWRRGPAGRCRLCRNLGSRCDALSDPPRPPLHSPNG
mmetsp:Transcript_62846/g.187371  ORF Transcript_62846/g.187371 Transcript_62846/m.187371 type:complete len:283 (+) Transcript_62846:743-1591(+)